MDMGVSQEAKNKMTKSMGGVFIAGSDQHGRKVSVRALVCL